MKSTYGKLLDDFFGVFLQAFQVPGFGLSGSDGIARKYS